MRRSVRLLLAVLASAALLAATLSVIGALTGGLVAHAASSQADALPPIGTSPLTGSTIYAADGTTVLATIKGPEIRRPVALSQVSKVLITAVLDTEDQGFYVHGGFDIPAMVRALASDSSGGGLQGGSTITQQLVKQIYLSPARKISRKIKEAVLAGRLQQKYTRNQILQAYLNIIYLGNSAYGVQAAANVYFGEDVSKVDLPQAAMLAGLIQDPNGYDPINNPIAARTRRSEVLGRMVHYHDITQAQADAANSAPLPTRASDVGQGSVQTSPVFADYVSEVENELLGNPAIGATAEQRKQALSEGGLKIVTNLDPTVQTAATSDVALDTPAGAIQQDIRQGLVVINPATGAVEAIVGGTGIPGNSFDVMTDGTRQAGSGFKLFTLIAALEDGYSPYDTVDATAPCAIAFPGNNGFLPPQDGGPKDGKPATNDEGPGSGGVVNLVTATAQSLNCGFLRLAHEVTLPQVADWAQKLGITTPLALTNSKTGQTGYVPSMVLGSIPVRPIDMAAAYATVAANGIYHKPSFIKSVTDRSGTLVYSGDDLKGHRVLSTQIAAEATLCFRATVGSGTGTAAALYDRPVAGKTGTTSGPTDAWFNGYTPQLEMTVWMGHPSSTKNLFVYGAPVYGGTYPAHTWHNVAAAAVAGTPVEQFVAPDPALLPPAHYITSPGLVRDDHTDHNYYGNGYAGGRGSGSGGSGGGGYGSGGSGSGGSGSGGGQNG